MKKKKIYLSTLHKLYISITIAVIWAGFSFYVARDWIHDLEQVYNTVWAYCLVIGIAVIPGFFNIFLISSLLFDKRPNYKHIDATLPEITILIAAYNEEDSIADTLESIVKQE